MPIHPYDPTEDDSPSRAPPDIGEIVDRILNDGDRTPGGT